MSELHKALEALQPRDWSEIPQNDLNNFLTTLFSYSELIVDSVPSPPGGSHLPPSSTTAPPPPATKATELIHSNVRPPPPPPDIESLQKSWGKPLKIAAKDNPLGITMYKMAGHDRHGAWFARRSVHEGLGFTKWKKAMQREFPVSLAVEGGPGEGSVRGIGADRRIEHKEENVGKLEVYQLSAQFPGPVAPREFITCLVTTDKGLSDSSASQEHPKDSTSTPRHYMVVSIPVDHPDAPIRNGLVRGHYESVEMIREIPIASNKSFSTPNLLNNIAQEPKGRDRGSTIGFAESRGLDAKGEHVDRMASKSAENMLADEGDTNPVEWIMITRSDPGGGIPRFMVERGTPASITADAAKFIDWAAGLEDIPDIVESVAPQDEIAGQKTPMPRKSMDYSVASGSGHLAGIIPPNERRGSYEPSGAGETGIIASLTNYAQTGVENYAPNIVQNNMPNFMKRDLNSSDDDSDSDSDDSFTSATADYKTAREGSRSPDPLGDSTSTLNVGVDGDDSSGRIAGDDSKFEQELKKIQSKRRTLDEKMMKAEETEREKTAALGEKEEKDAEKQREKIEKEKKKQQDRYAKELKKLEDRRAKEEKRLEDRRRKAQDKDVLSKTQRERDEYRRQLEILRRENELLRRQMGELQRENTLLVQRVGKSDEGKNMLRQVKDEFARERGRASSVGSKSSVRSSGGKSGDTKASG
ncbi:hypothetical protein EJ08DRAFT_659332 [Tothia fuscella]|uniref:DUF3074 domain-containing protein n=1 Tax=Tothia fuscella TaxID=1048955 RepID=A0A9P4U0K2_9PEZI|nr:hypothetical protein EJ08DRAFT_659332 [Tothia fuscella]